MPGLTDNKRHQINDELLERSLNGVLPRGGAVGSRYVVEARTVDYHGTVAQLSFGKEEWRCLKLKAFPLEDRQDIQHAACAAGVSRYMVAELLRQGLLKRRTGRVKSALTDDNKLRRVEYALSYLDDASRFFEPMLDVVHVDEKWFNADKDKRSYILLDGEEPPQRSRQSKRFIPKTMFLAAVARPR
ncbi:unnamed protein product [Phytophthora fragariaefolia]|uniref:Unnamed protein product n=1 Tax=Phytophthora fragariaefolia TaxID=1490495 RepID=A0A9W7CLI2_9STRA|nr:unnamed protein product [Phytophthora fragariaefolia]